LSERLSYVLDHWDGSALAAFWEADTLGDVDAAENADALRLEVDVADAEREKFAEPAAGEGGGQIDRAVLFRSGARFLREWLVALRALGRANERVHLVGPVEGELFRVVRDADACDIAGGVRRRQLVRAAGKLEDAADYRDELRGGARCDRVLLRRESVGAPLFDGFRGDGVELEVAEGGEEVAVERGAVVAFR
jgi:hypothetical protein